MVPLADVLVSYPGGSAEEVERLVASRLERLLYQIDGVEYVYSMSQPGMAVVTVRFFVGEDREDSLIKLYNKIQQNVGPGHARASTAGSSSRSRSTTCPSSTWPSTATAVRSPTNCTGWPRRWSPSCSTSPTAPRITMHGGEPRVVHVYLDPDRLAAYGLSLMEMRGALLASNAQRESGTFEQADEVLRVEAGPFLQRGRRRGANLMVGMHADRPVYLRDVARVVDGPAEVETYSRIGFGPAHDRTWRRPDRRAPPSPR